MANYHVTPGKDDWGVVREGADRASDRADTQREAEKIAKELAGNSGGGEVAIHDRDNKIRDKDTVPPAHDPFPPRDRRH